MSTKPNSNFQQKKKMINYMCLDHDEKLTRQLSNLSSKNGEAGYHGGKSASIPFTWESQPGTPKVRSQESYLPPLTPPPSYFQNATKKPITKSKKNTSKASFLQTMFPKRATRKGSSVPPPAPLSSFQSYSTSSSSSSLSSSSPRPTSSSSYSRPTSYSVPASPMVHWRRGDEEDQDLYDVSDSNMCYGNAKTRGRYSSMFKKVLLGDFL